MRYPVIDAAKESGGDIYGYATTQRGARRVAEKHFVDGVKRIEVAYWEPGKPAWLAISGAWGQ